MNALYLAGPRAEDATAGSAGASKRGARAGAALVRVSRRAHRPPRASVVRPRASTRRKQAVVNRLYRDFAAGVSPKASRAGAQPSKRVPSTVRRRLEPEHQIHGNASRGTGILNNELYVGLAGVEPPTLRQGSGHRKAGLAAQPLI